MDYHNTIKDEARFWRAVEEEDYEGMCAAAGMDPSTHIVAFSAADIMQATVDRFAGAEWTFADAVKAVADPSRYDEACLAMGAWVEYVDQAAEEIVSRRES